MYATFVAHGIAFSTWVSRVPSVRDALGISAAQLGTLLLALAVGGLVVLPFSGRLVAAFGSRRVVVAGPSLMAAGLLVVAFGLPAGPAVVAVGLFLAGVGHSTWDIAMNVQATAVERRLARPLMPRFHSSFSIGAAIGSGLAALLVAAGTGVALHLIAVMAVVVVAAPLVARMFVPDGTEDGAVVSSTNAGRRWSAWREPRTLMIGVLVFAFAFAESVGNDWLSVGVIDGHKVSEASGTTAFWLFTVAMTIGRFCGPFVIEKWGRAKAPLVFGGLTVVGVVLVAFGGSFVVSLIGAVVWGLGIALGLPLGISAAGDDPARAAARLSVVMSIAYVAFLAEPLAVGYIADATGTTKALSVAAALTAVGLCFTPSLRRESRTTESEG
nr:MFS transporter [Amycolatopsis acidicola]